MRLETSETLDSTQAALFTSSVQELTLSDFRNHSHLRLELEPKPILITGTNGAGKTNILEAISFLSPGRGLRNAKLSDVALRQKSELENPWAQKPWIINAKIRTRDGIISIGTGTDVTSEADKRAVHIAGEKIRGQAALAEHLAICYLTPQMDQVFASGSGARRHLLDRIVALFAPDHVRHLSIYEHAKSERKRLLKGPYADEDWLHVLETRMSEQAVAIATARLETIGNLEAALASATSIFPSATLVMKGPIEQHLKNGVPALEAEHHCREMLALSRTLDRQTGRTNTGIHKSQFLVYHEHHGMEAEFCSTGEQKALLISIILASARAKAQWGGVVPILLLDEIAAHLDEVRREALFNELLSLKTQCWMTATDTQMFEHFLPHTQHIALPK